MISETRRELIRANYVIKWQFIDADVNQTDGINKLQLRETKKTIMIIINVLVGVRQVTISENK